MKLFKKLTMMLLVLAIAASTMMVSFAEEPFEITVYCAYQSTKGIDPDTLWWWDYAEYRLAQLGYNAKITVTGGLEGNEATQGKALRLGSNNLPDIMWCTNLSGSEVMLYGDAAGMLLDITPYLNETYMPNTYECAQTNGAAAFKASTTPSGKIYGLPYVVDRTLGWVAGTSPATTNVWVNSEMLADMGYEMPTTVDELLEVLRAAKGMVAEDGTEIIPMLARDGGYLLPLLYAANGFYGGTAVEHYGVVPCIKNGEVVLPVYTEEYKGIMEFMNAAYTEGLIPEAFFTMDSETEKALAKEGNFLFYAGSVNNVSDKPEIFKKYNAIYPIQASEDVKTAYAVDPSYTCFRVWASANTEHPEAVCALLDLLYEDEAMAYMVLGPVISDPIGKYEYAWQPNEDGTDLVHPLIGSDKTYTTTNDHQWNNISPNNNLGDQSNYTWYSKKVMAGLDFELKYQEYTDCITGETVTVTDKSGYPEKYNTTVDSYSRLNRYNSWINNLTTVKLSVLYCNEEESQKITDLDSVINSYTRQTLAQFVTGGRSLDTFDAFQEELESMGIGDLLEIYQNGFASYIDSIFD